MITEVTFARDFVSFWRLATPTMDGFVRRLNRGLYERDFLPMSSKVSPNRRAFVNEVAFHTFCKLVGARRLGQISIDLDRLVHESAGPLTGQMNGEKNVDNELGLSAEEVGDIREQVQRLQIRLTRYGRLVDIQCKPSFPGCGMVDRCEGDILVGAALIEIKAGDRPFRSVDLRQVLTYLVLNHAGRVRLLETVGLVNPRTGTSFEIGVEEFCFEVGGRHSSELFEFIAYAMSSGDVSR